jgi:hypothetical protein
MEKAFVASEASGEIVSSLTERVRGCLFVSLVPCFGLLFQIYHYCQCGVLSLPDLSGKGHAEANQKR